jgi:hypothetical protein
MTKNETPNGTQTGATSGIPISRAILYFLLLGAIPLFCVFFAYSSQCDLQQSLHMRLSEACIQVTNQNYKECYSKLIRQTFQDKDHFYLEKQVGTITPLSQEITALQKMLAGGFHPDEEAMRRRLTILTGPENALTFSESAEKSYAALKETQVQLSRSVEVDIQDVRKILARIEGVQIGPDEANASRPHLIITDFKIDKKKGLHSEVYLLNLKILKREYLK